MSDPGGSDEPAALDDPDAQLLSLFDRPALFATRLLEALGRPRE